MTDVDRLGIGVMLNILSDNSDSVAAYKKAHNKKIRNIVLDEDANGGDGMLKIIFDDNSGLGICDNGRSCCESRYLHTDDKLSDFIGSVFTGVDIQNAPDITTEYGDHEVQFLKVNTSIGTFTVETHNEHNGYYGGFAIVCKEL